MKKIKNKENLKVNHINCQERELNKIRGLCQEVATLANSYGVDFFFVTEGASICSITKNKAVRYHRECQKNGN